jgi:glyceraldehyde 3-phosphate dehydrogenase
MEGILGISEDPLVSSDFAGNPHSSIVDIALTTASSDRLFKVVSWYDNEWGYSMRVADITSYIADSL